MRQAIAVAVFLEKQKLWGQAIGVEVTRSKDTLVAFMGVLLSGNYYVPVSREMPEEKVEGVELIRVDAAKADRCCLRAGDILMPRMLPRHKYADYMVVNVEYAE